MNDNAGAEALLQVRTRAGDETTVSYPVQVYVFQSDECRAVPSAATAVSVTIAPLWQSLTVGGTYSGTAGSQTISLTKQSDGRTWKTGGGLFLLPPSSEPASVGVSITLGGTTKTYTYSTTDELSAGYRISIDGTYTEAIGVNLTGTITGATWLGQRTISFTFDESGSAAVNTGGINNDNQDNQDNFPAVGGTYEGCYVLAVDVADGGQSAELTILSPNEQAVTSAADVETKLSTLGSGGISGWDVPTSAQLKLVEAQKSAIANAAEGKYYLYRNADGSKYYYHRLGIAPDNQSFGSAIGGPWPDSFEILLRPVAVVTVAAE